MVRVRLPFILAALCLLYHTAAAQSLGSVLTDAPKCATDCLFDVLARKDFVGKNQTVICSDKQFANAIGDCLTAKCTMRQTMDFIKMSAAVCGIRPTNEQTKYRVATIIMAALAVVFFALRITAKVVLSLPWGLDDTLTVLSVYFIFVEIFYVIGLVLVKAAVLCFFLRIFPDNKFRMVVKCTLAFNFLMGITFFVLIFFQTQPLSLFWEGWQKQQAHLVMSGITKLTLPHAGLSLLVDVWMLVLPLTQLWGLGLKLRKKLGVIAMFSIGIFLTIVAAIRVSELVLFASSADLTVLNAQKAIIWSSIEICVGIMVACMPHIHHLVRHIAARVRKRNGEMEDSNRGVFVDRSLAKITVDNATGTTGPQLHDEGGLLEKNITASATTGSRNTGSLGYSSDAETQV
ncbi:hypothetical protein KAF25_001505 [Fusarium avenaceum]|uniref:Extracellular membrane protein CFEM domain-containing protein n=1 Tax=Fusarium avenaceum TaxID=40199 RepID=A0A9P7KVU1_9HYPO|nr:hypothetical protein KAF25_001505 [Fusarium avenaceum]